MTLAGCSTHASAVVALLLDTRAPTVTVVAEDRIAPPAEWAVTVAADEPIGSATLTLRDSTGTVFAIGYERIGDRRLVAYVPSHSLAGDVAVLTARVGDLVGNVTAVERKVFVDRPRSFDVELLWARRIDARVTLDTPLDVDLSLGRAYAVEVTRRGGIRP